jgi:hypothetical protein
MANKKGAPPFWVDCLCELLYSLGTGGIMDIKWLKNRTTVFCSKIRKRTPSKKSLLISCLVSIVLLTLYVGSYRHFRNKSIEISIKQEKARPRRIDIPSGYYIQIIFGVGLSNGNEPPRGCLVCPWVKKQGKSELCKWMYYLYYPLIQLEIKIWQIKTFGWE